ncbi:MAG: Rod shape-determining protein MreC [Candidatus Taylorbacteria bacterium]|nr:Rod shape-determining protein MreC [Candidatus Taylorbacteria bacterium]
MNYQLKNSSRRRKNPAFAFLGIGFVIILIAWLIFSPNSLSLAVSKIISPFWNIDKAASGSLSTKASLEKENARLQQKIEELAPSDARIQELTQENLELKELLGRTAIKDGVLAAVVKKPPFSPYDTLIIDAGTAEGIAAGDMAYALGNIPIGKVEEVRVNSAKISLYSNPGLKYEVSIGPKNIMATATARGGGAYEVTLPRDAMIQVGDPVTMPSVYSSVFGTVSTVIAVPARAFATILFNSPVNANELRWVIIQHSGIETF